MKATVTLTLNIGAKLDPKLILDKFEEFLTDSFHDSGYYAPDETPTPRPVDTTVWVTNIKSVLHDETPTRPTNDPKA